MRGVQISFEAGSRPDAGLLHIRAVLGRAAKRCGASGGLSWHCDLAGEDEVSEGTEMYTDSEDDDESWEYDTNSSVSTGDGLAERWCETLRDSRKEVDE